jgi:hypothetical protein
MSVQNGLERAREILQNPKVKKAWDANNSWDRWQREKAISAIEKALERYKGEAQRVKKYLKNPPQEGP